MASKTNGIANSYAPSNPTASYLKDAGFYFILWGVIVMAYCAATYYAFSNDLPNKTWIYLFFAIGGIVSYLRNRKSEDESEQAPAVNKVFSYTWITVGILLAILWLSAPFIGILYIVPVSLLLYGAASLVTGSATKFLPSIIGALVCLACAVFTFKYDYATQHLISIIAICSVHVVPGIFMRKQA